MVDGCCPFHIEGLSYFTAFVVLWQWLISVNIYYCIHLSCPRIRSGGGRVLCGHLSNPIESVFVLVIYLWGFYILQNSKALLRCKSIKLD